jgi:hypothetical protein
VALVASLCVATGPARAECAAVEARLDAPTAARVAADVAIAPDGRPVPEAGSPLAIAASLVPGVLLHGSGHFALGEHATARRLLISQGVGLGALAVGMGLMGAVGGSEKLAPLYVVPAVGGATVFLGTWLVDAVGAASGGAGLAEPWAPSGRLYLAAGYAGLYDSRLDLPHNLSLSASWYGERWWSSASALVHPDGLRYAGIGNRLGYRLWRPDDPVDELSAVLWIGHQRFDGARFSVTTAELYADGRVNLGRLGPTLRNGWFRFRLGAGLDAYGYDSVDGRDLLPVLVVGAGFGFQVHRSVGFELIYMQKKNELPGGIVGSGGPDGFLGMVELSGRVRLHEGWSLLPGLRIGAGLMPSLAVEARAW